MKAVILAAGKGIRMLPLTKERPKHLIEVAGKPFLHYVINAVHKAGISDIGIVTHYKEEMIADFIKEENIDAELIHQENTNGTGAAIMSAKDFTEGKDFIVLMGDGLYSYLDIKKLNNGDAFWYLACKKHENPERYGVIVLGDNGFIRKIIEKPKEPPSKLINIGLYKFKADVYEKLEAAPISERGEIEVIYALNKACEERKLKALITDYWADLGRPEDIPIVERIIKEGRFPL
ncbi:hypothetical protein DRN74_01065 [Candidatus Micrarchaeota archaeon]|nr:MAG: hypothetical protein DRN74_01065 [Candidatus Micrarchaeota archaeon]